MNRNDSNTKILSTIILVLLFSSVASLKIQQDTKVFTKVLATVDKNGPEDRFVKVWRDYDMLRTHEKLDYLYHAVKNKLHEKYQYFFKDFLGKTTSIEDCFDNYDVHADKDSNFCKSYIIYHFLVISIVCKTISWQEGYTFKDVPITECLRAHFTAKKWANFPNYTQISREENSPFFKVMSKDNKDPQEIRLKDFIEYNGHKQMAISCKYTPPKK